MGKVTHGVKVWVVRYAATGPALNAAHGASDAAPEPLAGEGTVLSGLLAMPDVSGQSSLSRSLSLSLSLSCSLAASAQPWDV